MPSDAHIRLYEIWNLLGIKMETFAARLPICYEGLLMEIKTSGGKDANSGETFDEKREKARAIYKKYELLTLPKYYRWISAEGMI